MSATAADDAPDAASPSIDRWSVFDDRLYGLNGVFNLILGVVLFFVASGEMNRGDRPSSLMFAALAVLVMRRDRRHPS